MAKLVIALSPTDTGHVLADFTWDFCTQISSAAAISTTGCTLTELGYGQYILNNPNVVADTAFRLHLTASTSHYASGIFSTSDDNHTLASVLGTPAGATIAADIAAVNAKTTNLPASPAAVGSAMALSGDFTATMKTSLNAATPASVTGSVGSVTAAVSVTGDLSAIMKTSVTTAVNAAAVTLAASQPNYAPAVAGAAMTLTSAYDAAKSAASASSVAAIPTNPLLASAYTAPDNADIAAARADLESLVYGLAAIKTALGSVTATVDLSPVTSRLDNGTYGLAAIKTALGSITATVDLSSVTSRLDDSTHGLTALLSAITSSGGSLTAAQVWAYVIASGQTAQELLAKLYIPDSTTPVMVVPANTDPDVQFVYFYGKNGDISPVASQVVSAIPSPGQVQDQNLISKQKLAVTLGSDGSGYLTLICGVEYRVLASWWGEPFTMTVTADTNRTFAAYVADALAQ